MSMASADMVKHFREVLVQCKVTEDEKVLIFSDPQFEYDSYVDAAFAAAGSLGANAYVMLAASDSSIDDELCQAAWSSSDFILGMTRLPGKFSWMYSELHSIALASGARVLMVQESPDVLKRLQPHERIRRRGIAGARLVDAASTVHLFSKNGTDLTFGKAGRKGSYQCGVADVPGRWDHWPSGMVYCAPDEYTANGVLVASAGDIAFTLRRYVTESTKFYFENGLVTKIEGGYDAEEIRRFLAAEGTDGAYRLAHAGWGIEDRAQWTARSIDAESYYGGVTIAFGRNHFDSPIELCGLGGLNRADIHLDICCKDMSLSLDGDLVLEKGEFISKELR